MERSFLTLHHTHESMCTIFSFHSHPQGEDALLAARASDKKLADFLGSEDSSSGAAKGAEEPGEDFSESSAACEALGSGGSGPSMITAKQPALVQGLQMKKYVSFVLP